MRFKTITAMTIPSLCMFLLCCVTIKLPQDRTTRSKNVIFASPKGSFTPLDQRDLDSAWLNSTTGNIISYFSDCNPSSDRSLSALRSEIIVSIEHPVILKSETKLFNHRNSVHSQISGTVDGVPSLFDIIVFKKNGCIYAINYIATHGTYEKDKLAFLEFIKEFKVP